MGYSLQNQFNVDISSKKYEPADDDEPKEDNVQPDNLDQNQGTEGNMQDNEMIDNQNKEKENIIQPERKAIGKKKVDDKETEIKKNINPVNKINQDIEEDNAKPKNKNRVNKKYEPADDDEPKEDNVQPDNLDQNQGTEGNMQDNEM